MSAHRQILDENQPARPIAFCCRCQHVRSFLYSDAEIEGGLWKLGVLHYFSQLRQPKFDSLAFTFLGIYFKLQIYIIEEKCPWSNQFSSSKKQQGLPALQLALIYLISLQVHRLLCAWMLEIWCRQPLRRLHPRLYSVLYTKDHRYRWFQTLLARRLFRLMYPSCQKISFLFTGALFTDDSSVSRWLASNGKIQKFAKILQK